jgi:hypothetical protein
MNCAKLAGILDDFRRLLFDVESRGKGARHGANSS